MFRVSLLPESYRKYMQGRATKDIVSKVALLILVCLFIVYAGFAVKNIVVENKLKQLERENNALLSRVPELQKYRVIYNDYNANQAAYQSIKPQGLSTTEFISRLIKDMPSNVHVKQIDLTNGSCTLDCVTNSREDVFDTAHYFAAKDYVTSVSYSDITKEYFEDGTQSVSFRLTLRLPGATVAQEDEETNDSSSMEIKHEDETTTQSAQPTPETTTAAPSEQESTTSGTNGQEPASNAEPASQAQPADSTTQASTQAATTSAVTEG